MFGRSEAPWHALPRIQHDIPVFSFESHCFFQDSSRLFTNIEILPRFGYKMRFGHRRRPAAAIPGPGTKRRRRPRFHGAAREEEGARRWKAPGWTARAVRRACAENAPPARGRPPGAREAVRENLARKSHQLSAADADPCAVTGRTPESRFNVVRLRLQQRACALSVRAASHSAVSTPSRRKLVRFPG